MLKKISFWLSFLLISPLIINLFSCTIIKPANSQNNSNWSQNKTYKNKINNIYFLGDSLVDTGGFLKVIHSASEELKKLLLINTLFKDKLEQLSILKLPNFYYGDCFSNGLVISENLSNKFNVPIKSGWNLNLNILDLINIKTATIGNNYAFSGSCAYYDEKDEQLFKTQLSDLIANNPNNIDEIIKVLFKMLINEFALIKQSDALIKHRSASNFKPNDLFLILIGGNDLGRLVFEIGELKKAKNNQNVIDLHIAQFLNNSITNIETTITNLIKKQAQKIVITNCVDISKSPQCLKCSATKNKSIFNLVRKYNAIWSEKINKLQLKYPNFIKQYDIFKFCNKLINQMKTRKMIVNISASGLDFETIFEKMFIGNKDLKFNDYTDNEINNYFFIDDSHPTKEIHRLVAEEVFKLFVKWK